MVTGVVACLWFVVWMLLVHDSPDEHPSISDEERHYIQNSVGVRQVCNTYYLKVGMCKTGMSYKVHEDWFVSDKYVIHRTRRSVTVRQVCHT